MNIWLILMVIIWLMMVNDNLVGWFEPTPLKNNGVKVSWEHIIPNIWKNNPNVPVTTNQK